MICLEFDVPVIKSGNGKSPINGGFNGKLGCVRESQNAGRERDLKLLICHVL